VLSVVGEGYGSPAVRSVTLNLALLNARQN